MAQRNNQKLKQKRRQLKAKNKAKHYANNMNKARQYIRTMQDRGMTLSELESKVFGKPLVPEADDRIDINLIGR